MFSLRKIFLPILLTAVAVWILWSVSRPFVLTRTLSLEVQPLQEEKKRLQEENERLAQRIKEMNTPQALEIEAHRRGWIKRGERRLVLVKPTSEESKDAQLLNKKNKSLFAQMHDWARTRACEFLDRNE